MRKCYEEFLDMNVLITDDSSIGRQYIQKTLMLSGVASENIFHARNGKEALAILDEKKIKIIFLDINMPVMSGEAVVDILQERGMLSELTVVITSSLANEQKKMALSQKGVGFFLKKPFPPEELKAIFEKASGI
ncbi:MAG: hypothetical protein A2504_14445 [Bdellovibrionales bacterium RIFOXYD12_FULL_39_22]|nr:MAG: hypothetical protein A2385_04880 [Bdellovibrionales bacterium RIFOXYB1_FULL_39_21]OFZ43481.1 MAG: hypothetical protein A2485_13395 [Bdellovibrionales bacterium RIFOXYC12_FULL_39_17]OFZ47024.1 MAG: hypothetical protein A2404_00455 [Bdellovibrionales bacterium RIFOXYC1_FULL_39_130]OFZ76221.1 MAG: hypothetical protein A2560_07705 [Bdellovibrionales bacterium RIFOXYD1_FULL_39_84]OFZ94456.1 MAG: hypothetical protein A2504_14445 [Bdellovibrionales bacterium RIFOXYD12_FULL_39_22]